MIPSIFVVVGMDGRKGGGGIVMDTVGVAGWVVEVGNSDCCSVAAIEEAGCCLCCFGVSSISVGVGVEGVSIGEDSEGEGELSTELVKNDGPGVANNGEAIASTGSSS